MKDKIVLMILIDGLRHDYINIEDAPFLTELGALNIEGSVRETFAFELRPAFFAGLQPQDCGVGNMYYYSPDTSPFKKMDTSLGDRGAITKELRRDAKAQGHTLLEYVGSPAEIPIELLKYFDFSEKYHTADLSSLGEHKTLFDYLREDKRRWTWIGYPDGTGLTKDIIEEFNSSVSIEDDFIYLHFSELDWAGHEQGPHSDGQRRILKEIDDAVRQVYVRLNNIFSDVRGLIFGDHGQVEIKKHINLEEMLNETGLKCEEDYLYFLDSTQARFWFFNDEAREKVATLLGSVDDGKLLSEDDLDDLRFRFDDSRFGELIFVVNDGVGIFPNFFQHENPCKGLHGYLPEVEANWAKIIVSGTGLNKKLEGPVEMVDIFPTLLDMFGYEKPGGLEAVSLVDGLPIGSDAEEYEVSLVMPTYNRLSTLKKCVDAIESQDIATERFELVIVDDGSSDGTKEFLEKLGDGSRLNLKLLRQDNSGPAAARNLGLHNASGHIIILVGDDTIMSPGFIECHLSFHKKCPEIASTCLGLIEWSEDIEVDDFMRHITSKDGGQQFNYDLLDEGDPNNIGYGFFWSSNLSFKRLFVLTQGLFNEKIFKLAMWEDTELGYRLERCGMQLHYRKDCVVFHEHKVDLDSFARRQRMVGWHGRDLTELGIPCFMKPSDLEKSWFYSSDATEGIVKAVKTLKENGEIEPSTMKDLYNFVLTYASLIGIEEREDRLKTGLGCDEAIFYNFFLTKEQLSRREMQIEELNVLINRKQSALEEKDLSLEAKDHVLEINAFSLEAKDKAIEEREQRINDLTASLSWRITAPLRAIMRLLSRK